MLICYLQLPVADPFLEKVNLSDLGEFKEFLIYFDQLIFFNPKKLIRLRLKFNLTLKFV